MLLPPCRAVAVNGAPLGIGASKQVTGVAVSRASKHAASMVTEYLTASVSASGGGLAVSLAARKTLQPPMDGLMAPGYPRADAVNLKTRATCIPDSCSAIVGVECLPPGAEPCKRAQAPPRPSLVRSLAPGSGTQLLSLPRLPRPRP